MKLEPIAIIGMGCRFPKSKDPKSFWQILQKGVDTIVEIPPDRWDVDEYYDPKPDTKGKTITRWGGFIDDAYQFDPSFFGLSLPEARRVDPQQRLVLEVAWEALENASVVPTQLAKTQTGVFIGISHSDHHRILYQDFSEIDGYNGPNTYFCIAANRLSYLLNLQGPSMAVDTACSSSLVAVHLACQSLRSRECPLAIAGGVNLHLSPEELIALSHLHLLSAEGRCKTFDATANGYVRGEGCGIVILKRLSDALQNGDNILSVIRGSAVNHNGCSNGLTAPNGLAQETVIRQALQNAGVAPAQISYVETHGTATQLGDSLEFDFLKSALMQERSQNQTCWLGSVKTNIGHLEAAAGIAGLIKVVLAFQHQEIPANLHFTQLNPYISLEGTTFAIPTQPQPWSVDAESRMAGVSSFGFGGTNAHIVLEEAPISFETSRNVDRPLHLLTLSAKSETALRELASRYEEFLILNPSMSLADICFTANMGRSQFNYRLAVVASSIEQLRQNLVAFVAGRETDGVVSGQIVKRKAPKLAFLFSNCLTNYVGMGRQLYQTQPTFRACLDRCNEILRPYLKRPLIEVIYPASGSNSGLDDPLYLPLSLFSLEYALAQLWQSWGVVPNVLIGRGIGEYVAACVAGVFSLEYALKLMVERVHCLQASPLEPEMLTAFERVAQAVTYSSPNLGIISLSSGERVEAEMGSAFYWSRQLQQPSGQLTLEILQQHKLEVVVEVGCPKKYYESLEVGLWLPSLSDSLEDWSTILQSLAKLYLRRGEIDWISFDRDYSRHRLQLPTYPFQRQLCRFEMSKNELEKVNN